jgi:hypothetical protein
MRAVQRSSVPRTTLEKMGRSKDEDHDREGDDENLRDGNQLTGGQKTEASRGRW